MLLMKYNRGGYLLNFKPDNFAIICTKDRENILVEILKSLDEQSTKFDRILLVDSSVKEIKIDQSHFETPVEIVSSKPGLTLQRNYALSVLSKEDGYCHFFDDDVTLDKLYLSKFNNYVNLYPSIEVATGRQIEAKINLFEFYLYKILNLNGKILFNGMNITPDYSGRNKVKEINWMPGCNMIISLKFLRNHQIVFDDKDRSGYCMGEDVDISLKVTKYTKIIYLPLCKYIHRLSNLNRNSQVLTFQYYFRHRLLLTKTFPNKFKIKNLLFSLKIEYLLNFILFYLFKYEKSKNWIEGYKLFLKNEIF